MDNARTITSREFSKNVSAAMQLAMEMGTVMIADRGVPVFALLHIDQYQRLVGNGKSMVELLVMAEADKFDFEPEPIKFGARDLAC